MASGYDKPHLGAGFFAVIIDCSDPMPTDHPTFLEYFLVHGASGDFLKTSPHGWGLWSSRYSSGCVALLLLAPLPYSRQTISGAAS